MKPIKRYKGMYSVTTNGRVISHKRARTDGRVYPEKELKQSNHRLGYKIIDLHKDGEAKKYYVHRLVADAFVPNPEKFKTVNHLDGNKANNDYRNLEWCSFSNNHIHSYRVLGRTPWNKGVKAKDHPKLAAALDKAHEAARGQKAWNRGLKYKQC